MHDIVRSAAIGFVSGILGALLVLWISGPDQEPASETVPDSGRQTDSLVPVTAIDERPNVPDADVLQNPDIKPGATEPAPPPRAAEPVANLSRIDRRAEFGRRQQERMTEQLRAAGWSDSEIGSLDELQNAARLEMEERMYEQMRQAIEDNADAYSRFVQPNTIRDTLGEEKYEQYLEALGRPTALTVNSLLKGSAGEMAGLQQGDVIRRYGSDRVYNEQDLMMAVLRGEPGEAVTIEIERDGTTFHVTVPRGPLGTSQMARMMVN